MVRRSVSNHRLPSSFRARRERFLQFDCLILLRRRDIDMGESTYIVPEDGGAAAGATGSRRAVLPRSR
jgi:hypothetical protein